MARDLQRWGVWRFRPETQTLEYPHHDPFLDLNESNADRVRFPSFSPISDGSDVAGLTSPGPLRAP